MPSSEVARQTRQQVAEAASTPAATGLTVFDLIRQQSAAIQRALPNQMDNERFARIALTLVRNNKKLQECEPMSFIGSLMVAAQLGLEPGAPLGLSWIIPRFNNKSTNTNKLEAQFQIGYRGVIELFTRSAQFKGIIARPIHEHDDFSFNYGDNTISHTFDLREPRGQAYAYYAKADFLSGGSTFVVLSREDVDKRRARGQDGPAWKSDYDAMGCKSAIMALKNWLPLSPELERALAADNRSFTKVEPNMVEQPALEGEVLDDEPAGELGAGNTDPPAGAAPSTTNLFPPAAEGDAPDFVLEEAQSWDATTWRKYLAAKKVQWPRLLSECERLIEESPSLGAVPRRIDDVVGGPLVGLLLGFVEDLTAGPA